ncbi:10114_t:CDS:2 [Gigaspora margarita]|uniref:10114_t:CDS:1 n=1 Tax=Gigaspora margarita TaxID=4874 RepID=A0ABN7UW54_GIGMA|nr:10114_t:CDS:2 [Gigaspora margarita]
MANVYFNDDVYASRRYEWYGICEECKKFNNYLFRESRIPI